MLISTMTFREAAAHAYKERLAFDHRLNKTAHKLINKAKRYKRSTLTFTITAPHRTKFTVYVSDTRKKLFLVGAWSGKSFIIPRENGGLVFKPHFFERFAERFVNTQLTIEEAAQKFFKLTLSKDCT